MAEPSDKSEKVPGEVRSPIQVVVRVVLAVLMVVILVGVAWALVRLVSRNAAGPDASTLTSSYLAPVDAFNTSVTLEKSV